jgi:hypothetical protein
VPASTGRLLVAKTQLPPVGPVLVANMPLERLPDDPAGNRGVHGAGNRGVHAAGNRGVHAARQARGCRVQNKHLRQPSPGWAPTCGVRQLVQVPHKLGAVDGVRDAVLAAKAAMACGGSAGSGMSARAAAQHA